jgi:hypothetical protein
VKGEGTFGIAGIGTSGMGGATIKLENGETWTFVGAVLGLEAGFGVSKVSGEFPGHDHMAGACAVTVVGAAVLGAGSFKVEWKDNQGLIGTASGGGGGVDISAAGGLGGWTRH